MFNPSASSTITSNTGYYYLLVILAVVTMAVLRLLDTSRTGRAWRAVREDPLAAVLAATAALGFATHAIARAISASAVAGGPASTGWLGDALRNWVIVPANSTVLGKWGYVLLVCLLIALVQVKGRWRTILLVPTLCLASFVWETVLSAQPSVTRQIMIGAILIVMMIARPQGLLGSRRVEAPT